MYIPLDYYRILGLPIQATAEQLKHAHRDRTLQLPRREYSEAAIIARRELIDEAYMVLTDPAQRQTYDSAFLTKSYDITYDVAAEGDIALHAPHSHDSNGGGSPAGLRTSPTNIPGVGTPDVAADPHVSSIEIRENQLVGALLILLELGEYELVLKLGRPFLSSGNMSLESGRFGDPEVIGADIVLTVALACLELGREQWQQGQYENAAESLETGQELLLREGLFAGVRGEMQSDLFKLRPYRILELLAAPTSQTAAHYQGIQLLRDMLQERGGIDGTGDDQSGLSTDDFLRFVQQLRSYLTAEEQHALFEMEAQRPSAVATYLAVYALLARGFAYRMPALVRQAKLYLLRLGSRQDVQLEHSVCALLLGQTEEASEALESSKEYSALAFIRDHSKGSPDLLPGLCLYAERWLQNEVFPHFRDLAQQEASLKAYFGDEQVQAYLEALPDDVADSQWTTGLAPSQQWAHQAAHTMATAPERHYSSNGVYGRETTTAYGGGAATATLGPPVDMARSDRPHQTSGSAATATMPPVAERVSQPSSPPTSASGETIGRRRPRRSWFGRGRSPHDGVSGNKHSGRSSMSAGKSSRRAAQAGLRLDRMILLAAVGVTGLVVLWMIASRVMGWINTNLSGPQLQGEPPALALNEPIVPIPDPTEIEAETAAEATGEMTEAIAQDVLQRWFSAKSDAMGLEHNPESLESVLVGNLLSRWQNQSVQASQENWHWEYEHPELEVSDVTWNEENPDQAIVEATVQEIGEFYTEGQLNMAESYNSNLQVRYELVRDDSLWKIQDVETLN